MELVTEKARPNQHKDEKWINIGWNFYNIRLLKCGVSMSRMMNLDLREIQDQRMI